jgi:NADPH-dependent curcumin reductase
MTARVSRQWRLRARPAGLIKESDFEWREAPVAQPAAGQVLVRNVYLSLDPTNRGWMHEQATYMPPVALGDVVRGIAIGAVEESRDEKFQPGDLVWGMLGWQDYAVMDAASLTRIAADPSLPLTAQFGLLGHIGVTAYFGMLEIGQPKEGETLVVTAAAGAVGSLAGQIGKILGCRVVGIAGSDEKCHWITNELGFDAAINYKTEPLLQSLREHCPRGIDIDFENVGGKVLDTILSLINLRARIVLCGLISQYNATRPVPGPYHFGNLLLKRARLEGLIVLDHLDRADVAISQLSQWYKEGRLRYRVEVVEGLENAPTAINKLFDGSHKGKLIVKVSEEPRL